MQVPKLTNRTELFYVTYLCVTYPHYADGTTYEVIMSKKEIQSEIRRYNHILKIERCWLMKGAEVSIEDIKPQKYKGKPYTYREKYGGNHNGM